METLTEQAVTLLQAGLKALHLPYEVTTEEQEPGFYLICIGEEAFVLEDVPANGKRTWTVQRAVADSGDRDTPPSVDIEEMGTYVALGTACYEALLLLARERLNCAFEAIAEEHYDQMPDNYDDPFQDE